ncbi:SAF domain-containing protein, partial [Nocardioides sp.]|uniref:SAF domain-containing protein n=1 Tax=Nocardioides sp. TaxID=35761 RepID=UPI0019964C8C
DGAVDSDFSLEPHEFASLVRETKIAWQALGEARIGPKTVEREGLRFRRSLFVTRDVRAGEKVDPDNVRSVRPADGLPPADIDIVLGRTFTKDTPAGTPLSWDLV